MIASSRCALFPLQGAVNFKFGVLYALAHQCSDDEMFCNGMYMYMYVHGW